MSTPKQFAQRVLAWFDRHGRKDLPWQQDSSPYRVWVSEIMLQQTQVNTVIPYFQRFITRFPDIVTLAHANIDEVLALWAGLGYYARARNLHRTAIIIQQQYAGNFPENLDNLQNLPGIGRSTAGAILALAMGQRAPILDGNVKRVLTRFQAITGWPGQPAIAQQLWALADHYTPQQRVAEYTQAMMDLGAMVCTRSQPKCSQCPLHTDCVAYIKGTPQAYPMAKPRKTLPTRALSLLLLFNNQNEILLEKRPPAGIWGGLWSFPECAVAENVERWCKQQYGYEIKILESWTTFRHTFSHFHLDITPVLAKVVRWQPRVMERNAAVWYNIAQADSKGFAAPVKRLLEQVKNSYDAHYSLCQIK